MPNKILVYTFRTCTFSNNIQKLFPNTSIFGKLKQDLEAFFKVIIALKPDFILGIAESDKKDSFFEPITINKFNKSSKVAKEGKMELSLFVPNIKDSSFKIAPNPTHSFCNYSMYRIKQFLEKNELPIPFAFAHINKGDLIELPKILKK